MKKLLIILSLVFLFSCGSSDSNVVEPSSSSSSSEITSSMLSDSNNLSSSSSTINTSDSIQSSMSNSSSENSSTTSSNESSVSSSSSENSSESSSEISSESSSSNSEESSMSSENSVSSSTSSSSSQSSSEISSESSSSSENSSESSSSSSLAVELPNNFIKRVLIEEATGTWCGYCPDGLQTIREIKEKYGEDKVLVSAIHYADELSSQDGNSLISKLGGISGVPAGAVDRVKYNGEIFISRSYWSNLVKAQLNKQVNCGLLIDATRSDTLVVIVGSKEDINNYNLTIMVLENGILADQHNYMNDDPSSDYYQMGDVMKNFEHNHVLRDILNSNVLGDPISVKANSIAIYKFPILLNNVKDPSKVIFLGVITSSSNNEVINVNEVVIGAKSDW